MTEPAQGAQSFGDKLAYLIETVHPPDRGPYSYREIAARIAEHPGAMTAAHLHQLVKGKQLHPRIHHVEALASFFGVPVNYFFDDELPARIDERVLRVGVCCDEQVRRIAELLVRLPARDRDTVLTLIGSTACVLTTTETDPRPTPIMAPWCPLTPIIVVISNNSYVGGS